MKSWLRSAARWAADGWCFERFVAALELIAPQTDNVLRVLMYHRVDEPGECPTLAPTVLSATPTNFRRQMEFLAENYRVLSLAELLDLRLRCAALPPRAVIITFDDAYRDFAQHALPALEAASLPATLFVATAYPDQPDRAFWWDRMHHAIVSAAAGRFEVPGLGTITLGASGSRRAVFNHLAAYVAASPDEAALETLSLLMQRLKVAEPAGYVLGWDELRRIASRNVAIAPHTREHPYLNRVSLARARAEAVGSREDIESELGCCPPVLAYPGGKLSGEVVDMLRDEGFQMAFTTLRGVNNFRTMDPLRVRRINVGYGCPFGLWRGQLLAATRHLQRN